MATWITELNEYIVAEFDHHSAVATLATVRNNATPDARSVVLRKLLDDGRIIITSDTRSEKNDQLRFNPAATIVLWLPTQKKQFRMDGKIEILAESNALRLQAWQDSSDAARALFLWPPSGQPRIELDDVGFPKSVRFDQPMPADFSVLIFHPQSAETLDLNPHPHLRRKWVRDQSKWLQFIVNP